MHIQDAEFDLDLIPEPVAVLHPHGMTPRDAYQIRRSIEQRAELKRLRDLLGDPDLQDFE